MFVFPPDIQMDQYIQVSFRHNLLEFEAEQILSRYYPSSLLSSTPSGWSTLLLNFTPSISEQKTSDVLSFYKEELAGETINFISTQAKFRQKSKIQVLKDLADDVFECHNRILRTLEEKDPRVKIWYEQFAQGCFYFHTSLDMRYRLSDLFPLKPNAGLFAKES